MMIMIIMDVNGCYVPDERSWGVVDHRSRGSSGRHSFSSASNARALYFYAVSCAVRAAGSEFLCVSITNRDRCRPSGRLLFGRPEAHQFERDATPSAEVSARDARLRVRHLNP